MNEELEIFAEECAEAVEALTIALSRAQRIKSKIVRFGIDDYHPKNGVPNRQALENEIGHVAAAVGTLVGLGVLSQDRIDKAAIAKLLS